MKKFGVLCLILLVPLFARAQVDSVDPNDATEIGNNINFTLSPTTPGPRTPVHVHIESYGIDLGTATIIWKFNGTETARGTGLTDTDFTTGPLGSRSTISVKAITSDGTFVRSFDITPGEVDLFYQGNTYAPPFYKGRTLWSHQSSITLLAIPHIISGGVERNPRSLIYRWSRDGSVLGSLSGTGRNALTFTESALSIPTSIKVDVMTDRNTVVGTASMTIASDEAKALVYENNPLLGLLFNREVGDNLALTTPEVTFSAIPMFMSGATKRIGALSYNWTTNGAAAQTGDHVTYRTADATTGSANVGVSIINTNTVLQSAQKSFLVQFGQQTRSL